LLEQSPHLRLIIDPLLEVRRVLREQFQHLHKAMERLAESDETTRRVSTKFLVHRLILSKLKRLFFVLLAERFSFCRHSARDRVGWKRDRANRRRSNSEFFRHAECICP
jgi:hypothetical protein